MGSNPSYNPQKKYPTQLCPSGTLPFLLTQKTSALLAHFAVKKILCISHPVSPVNSEHLHTTLVSRHLFPPLLQSPNELRSRLLFLKTFMVTVAACPSHTRDTSKPTRQPCMIPSRKCGTGPNMENIPSSWTPPPARIPCACAVTTST